MKYVAKLLLINNAEEYLLLYRSNHPSLPYDPDLPGGIVEANEDAIQAVTREVTEETGVTLDIRTVEMVTESNQYAPGCTYYVCRATCKTTPLITLSWEHSSYEWLSYEAFIAKIATAKDTYMHMVHDYLVG